MIIRSEINSNYTCIPNHIIEDDNISWKSKSILIYLLSKPDNWNINLQHIANIGKGGIYAVRSGLKELEDAGYIHKEIGKGADGKFTGVEYYIYDKAVSITEHQKAANSHVTVKSEQEKELSSPARNPVSEKAEAGNTRMWETDTRKTSPIINTDNKQILRGTTTTTEPVEKPEPEIIIPEIIPEVLPSSYPAIKDNNLVDLLPEHFKTTQVTAVINKALLSHTRQEVEDAIQYSTANVRGGAWQYKAYLDQTLKNGWAAGYTESLSMPVINSFPAPARYQNGSDRVVSNYAAAADFITRMGVQYDQG